jgi:hypothetical protein
LASAAPPTTRHFWQTVRLPVLAAVLSLALFAAAFLVLLPFLGRPAHPVATPPRPTGVQLSEHLDAGRRALTEGNFHVALRELNAAVELRDRQPELLTPKQSRDLNQLQRQADLLARIDNLPLQDILKEAIVTPRDEEWQEHFDATHKGRSVLLDDVVRRDQATGWLSPACFEVRAGGEKAAVALDDLRILRGVPLDPPPRLIFGGRLKSMTREAGMWVIRFEPDSGVLLTDPDAAAACWPMPLDRDVLRTLQRQDEWLRDLPAQRPAP